MRTVLLAFALLAIAASATAHGFTREVDAGPVEASVSESGRTGDDAPGCAIGKGQPVPNPEPTGCPVDETLAGSVDVCPTGGRCLHGGGIIRTCFPGCSDIIVVTLA